MFIKKGNLIARSFRQLFTKQFSLKDKESLDYGRCLLRSRVGIHFQVIYKASFVQPLIKTIVARKKLYSSTCLVSIVDRPQGAKASKAMSSLAEKC